LLEQRRKLRCRYFLTRLLARLRAWRDQWVRLPIRVFPKRKWPRVPKLYHGTTMDSWLQHWVRLHLLRLTSRIPSFQASPDQVLSEGDSMISSLISWEAPALMISMTRIVEESR